MTTITVAEIEPGDDASIDHASTILSQMAEEWAAGDPPPTRRYVAASLFATSSIKRTRSWLATVDGEAAGLAVVAFDLSDENAHLVELDEFHVVPAFRRRGVATALLRPPLAEAAAEGRTSVMAWAWTDAGSACGDSLGMTSRQDERCSRLQIAGLDADQQRSWVNDAPARAAGYRLVSLPERCPDDLVEIYATAMASMADMPVDDLDWTLPKPDAALVRSREEKWAKEGISVIRSIALAPDGSGAGLSEIFVPTERPTLGFQGDTGVVSAHRGHRLGQWLKAANLASALERFPELRVIETFNAQTNPWMLSINVAMGFRPHLIAHAYQGGLAVALQAIG